MHPPVGPQALQRFVASAQDRLCLAAAPAIFVIHRRALPASNRYDDAVLVAILKVGLKLIAMPEEFTVCLLDKVTASLISLRLLQSLGAVHQRCALNAWWRCRLPVQIQGSV